MTPAGTFSLPASHPMFAGHFPGNPIVPGAYLLALVVQHANAWLRGQGERLRVTGVAGAKFMRPVRPGETCAILFGSPAETGLRFRLQIEGVPCASGLLALAATADA